MSASCWTSRYEAMGYATMSDAIVGEAHGFEGDEGDGEALHDWLDAVCLREDGHEGEHDFTPTDDIVVTFP